MYSLLLEPLRALTQKRILQRRSLSSVLAATVSRSADPTCEEKYAESMPAVVVSQRAPQFDTKNSPLSLLLKHSLSKYRCSDARVQFSGVVMAEVVLV